MGCKYVKDFKFDSANGYTGSTGKTEVKAYMRGGAVRKAPLDAAAPRQTPTDMRPLRTANAKTAMKEGNAKNVSGASGKVKTAGKYAEGGSTAVTPKQNPMIRPHHAAAPAAVKPEIRRQMKRDAEVAQHAARHDTRYAAGLAARAAKMVTKPAQPIPPTSIKNMAKGGKTKKAAQKTTAKKSAPRRSERQSDAMAEQVLAQMLSQASQTGTMPGIPMQGMPMPAPGARAVPVAPRGPMLPLKTGGMPKGQQAKVGRVMGEYGRGDLHSGSRSGPVVKNRGQAVAIAMSEARKKRA